MDGFTAPNAPIYMSIQDPYRPLTLNAQDTTHYWDNNNTQPPVPPPTSRRKVRFDIGNILTNMQLTADPTGQLYSVQSPFPGVEGTEGAGIPATTVPVPIPETVKHSYIYNKYFANYSDPNEPKIGPRRPRTREELVRMLLEDEYHRRKIAAIKTTKIPYTNSGPIYASKNSLRKMQIG